MTDRVPPEQTVVVKKCKSDEDFAAHIDLRLVKSCARSAHGDCYLNFYWAPDATSAAAKLSGAGFKAYVKPQTGTYQGKGNITLMVSNTELRTIAHLLQGDTAAKDVVLPLSNEKTHAVFLVFKTRPSANLLKKKLLNLKYTVELYDPASPGSASASHQSCDDAGAGSNKTAQRERTAHMTTSKKSTTKKPAAAAAAAAHTPPAYAPHQHPHTRPAAASVQPSASHPVARESPPALLQVMNIPPANESVTRIHKLITDADISVQTVSTDGANTHGFFAFSSPEDAALAQGIVQSLDLTCTLKLRQGKRPAPANPRQGAAATHAASPSTSTTTKKATTTTTTAAAAQPAPRQPAKSFSQIVKEDVPAALTAAQERLAALNTQLQKLQQIAQRSLTLKQVTDNVEGRKVVEQRIDEIEKELNSFCKRRDQLLHRPLRDCFAANELARECRRLKQGLPIYAVRNEIIEGLQQSRCIIVVGATGSGKSTQVVQYIADSLALSPNQSILCSQPRKLAATSLAERVNQEYGGDAHDVVFQGRLLDRDPQHPPIVSFVTHSLLLDELREDPNLSRFGCVVVDEVHERTVNGDICIALLRSLFTRRSDFYVVLTSATMDAQRFSDYFHSAKIFNVPGKTFPVLIEYDSGKNCSSDNDGFISNAKDLTPRAVDAVMKILVKENALASRGAEITHARDILVFLPGVYEITAAIRSLEHDLKKSAFPDLALCLPLHAKLESAEQNRALARAPAHKIKVVFATTIAETSVTIDGIGHIVDTGLANRLVYDEKRGVGVVRLSPISQSAANQRSGRAGRTAPGVAHRLYTMDAYERMDTNEVAEIMRQHPSAALLTVTGFGEDLRTLNLLNKPTEDSIASAEEYLELMGAFDRTTASYSRDADGQPRYEISQTGRVMLRIPFRAQESRLVLAGFEHDVLAECALIAAFFQSDIPLFRRGNSPADEEAFALARYNYQDEDGDAFVALAVFRDWIAAGKSAEWPMQHGVARKPLQRAVSLYNEALSALANALPGAAKDQCARVRNLSNVDLDAKIGSDKRRLIRRALATAYCNSIAVFSGSQSAGYHSMRVGGQVVLHPSTAFCTQQETPPVVMYCRVDETSRCFMKNVMRLDEAALPERIRSRPFVRNALKDRRLTCRALGKLGNSLLKCLNGPRGETLRELESLHDICISIDWHHHTVDVWYADPAGLAGFQNSFRDLRSSLELANIDIDMPSSKVRLCLSAGGHLESCLFEGQFNSVNFTGCPSRQSMPLDAQVREIFAPAGRVLKLNVWPSATPTSTRNGTVTFATPEQAARCIDTLSGQVMESGILQCTQAQEKLVSGTLLQGSSVVVTWSYSECTGMAFANGHTVEMGKILREYVDRSQKGHPVTLNRPGQQCIPLTLRPNKDPAMKNSIVIYNLPPDATIREIETALGAGSGALTITIQRKPINDSATIDVAMNVVMLQSLLGSVGEIVYLQTAVPANLTKNPSFSAIVAFRSPTFAQTAHELYDGKRIDGLGILPIAVKPDVSTKFKIPSRVYTAMSHRIAEIKADSLKTSQCRIGEPMVNGNYTTVKVDGGSLDEIQTLSKTLTTVCQGRLFVVPDEMQSVLRDCVISGGPSSRTLLSKLEKQTGAVSTIHMQRLRFFGTDAQMDLACDTLMKTLTRIEKTRSQETLRLEPTWLKALAMQNGRIQRKVEKEIGREFPDITIAWRFRKRAADVIGPREHVKAALGRLRAELENETRALGLVSGKTNGGGAADAEVLCPICICELSEDTVQLLLCGHEMCRECFEQMVSSNTCESEVSLPITCPVDGCNKSLISTDLQLYLTDEMLVRLGNAVLAKLTSDSRNGVVHCPSPNCTGYLFASQGVRTPTSQPGKTVLVSHCSDCDHDICLDCSSQAHSKRLCGEPEDAAVRAMLLKQGLRECRCKQMIQKTEGCNRVTCRCGVSVCWVCGRHFDSSSACYAHYDVRTDPCYAKCFTGLLYDQS